MSGGEPNEWKTFNRIDISLNYSRDRFNIYLTASDIIEFLYYFQNISKQLF